MSRRLFPFIQSKTKRPIYDLSDYIKENYGGGIEDIAVAENILDLLQGAHCVVTSRLHIALPCLAIGTPVLFIYSPTSIFDFKSEKPVNDVPRLSGLVPLLNAVEENYYYSNYGIYDLDNPPENKKDHLILRENLIKRCAEFIGKDNPYPKDGQRISALTKINQVNLDELNLNIFKTNIKISNDKMKLFRAVTMEMNKISGYYI